MDAASRENILGRIRENLAVDGREVTVSREAFLHSQFQRSALQSGHARKGLFERFVGELTLLGGTVLQASSREEIIASLNGVCRKGNYRTLILSCEAFVESLHLEEGLRGQVSEVRSLTPDGTGLIDQLREADAGLTACEYLAAETGTVVLRSSPAAPRSLSLLPRAHIVVAKPEQLLPTVAECLQQAHIDESPASSCITLVTGPSRTADIEKVLVRGVHGPRDLYVLFLGSPS
jgi:L-lactate dehydrogenase complex protein LldG